MPRHGRTGVNSYTGSTFGLQSLAAATSAHPLLFVSSTSNTLFLQIAGRISSQSAGTGIVVLAIVAVVAVGSWTSRRRELSALAVIALVVAGAEAWTMARISQTFVLSIVYLDRGLWIVGLLTWAVLLWAAIELIWALMARLRRRDIRTASGRGTRRVTRRYWRDRKWLPTGVTIAGLVAATASLVVPGLRVADYAGSTAQRPFDLAIARVNESAPQVEQLVPRGPVDISVTSPGILVAYDLLPGILWRLRSDGWIPQTSGDFALHVGTSYLPTRASPHVNIAVSASGVIRISRVYKAGGNG